MKRTWLQEELFKNEDSGFKEFHKKLIPTTDEEKVIGVRTPILRKLAKEMIKSGEAKAFMHSLPHKYYEENQVHGFILSEWKDYKECVEELEQFLPYIDNWATCDQTSPKIFKKHKEELLPNLERWLDSGQTYTIRFAIGMYMQHFLDEDFNSEYLERISQIRSQEYYVNMELAWYFATALAKQWDETIPYIENARLDKWVHNKTIQKARESYRISKEQKEYLKELKIK